MPYTVFLKKNEEKRLLGGHSWVYANEVDHVEGKDANGALASVVDSRGNFIGKGYVNHLSKILVRIFLRDPLALDDENFYLRALSVANAYRTKIGYDNCYRMVFAEADGLPGLIVDKYADTLVLQCLTLGIAQRRELIVDCLVRLFAPVCVYERSDVPVRAKEGLPKTKGVLYGSLPDEIIISENDVKMSVDVVNGQKTGYFLDQKENRNAIVKYCKDATVLDCFCNSGGFSMNAAKVARTVTAVDLSPLALANVKRNVALNNYSNVTTKQGDVFEILRAYKAGGELFDVIVLDPPAFTKSVSQINDALRGYKDINLLAMKLVRSGGFLVSSSCSHFITPVMFEKMLTQASVESRRTVRVVEVKTQSPDHPSLLAEEETQYLKFYILQVL